MNISARLEQQQRRLQLAVHESAMQWNCVEGGSKTSFPVSMKKVDMPFDC
ncbi:MAG: hypothetical protein IKJ45_12970 [Kiritimatiellae bacterium]|nr:hypothetical protein [Kiritimatiellia bacterium]